MSDNEKDTDKKPREKNNFPTVSFRDSSAVIGGQIGPYKLLSILGEGGFGIVYLAEQKTPVKRQVALKIIKPGMDSKQVIARFEAERQALALLEHPNIAHVFRAGSTESGRPYFAMEYIKGMPITEYCDHNKLSIEERLKLFIQVCEAVQHAHQKGIIHRDIKPSNIIVSVHDGKAAPKVIDFGVAKAISMPLTEKTMFTQQGQLIGTPEYMSPEQADLKERDIDTRTDIYSLGVVLYELLAGTLPFDPEALREAGYAEIQRIIREQEPPRPSTKLSSLGDEGSKIAKSRRTELSNLVKSLHKELEWIPLMAIRKERDQRYKTAYDLAEDVQNYLDDNPLVAGPESVVYRFKKFIIKRRGLVAAVGSVVIILLISLIIISNMYINSEKLRDAAVKSEKDALIAKTAAEVAQRIAEEERNKKEIEAIRAREAQDIAEREAYRATIQLVHNKISDGNLKGTRKVLEETSHNLRRWEWGYLMNLCQKPNWSFQLLNNLGWPHIFAVSTDGKLMAMNQARKFIMWDIEKGSPVWESPLGNQKGIIFDPNGKFIVGIFDNRIHVCDIKSGESLRFSERDKYESLCIDPNGKWIYAGTSDGTILKLDLQDFHIEESCAFNGQRIQLLLTDSKGTRVICALPPLTSKDGPFIYILDSDSLEVKSRIESPYYGDIHDMAIVPDSNMLLCAQQRFISIYSIETFKEIKHLQDTNQNMSSVKVSKNKQYIVGGSIEGIAYIYSANDFKLLKTFHHDSAVKNVAFQTNDLVLTLGEDGTIKQWSISKVTKQENPITVRKSPSPRDGVKLVEYRADSQMVAYSGWNFDKILLFAIPSQNVTYVCPKEFESIPWNLRIMAFRPNSSELVACTPGKLRFYDTNQSNYPEIYSIPIRGIVHDIAFDPSGSNIALSYEQGEVELIEVKTGNYGQITNLGENLGVSIVEFSPDGSNFVIMEQFGHCRIYMVETKTKQLSWKTNIPDNFLTSIAFHPKDKIFLTASDANIIVWDSKSGRRLNTFLAHKSSRINSINFNKDGSRLLSAGNDNMLRLWDWKLRKELLVFEQEWVVRDASFSPDGMTISSTSIHQNVGYIRKALPWKNNGHSNN